MGKVSTYGAVASLDDTDKILVVDDPGGTPATKTATLSQARTTVLGTIPALFEITFGDGDTSIREAADDRLYFQGSTGADIFEINLLGGGAAITGFTTGHASISITAGSYSWKNDASTQMKRVSAGVIAFDCAATEALRLTAAGMQPQLVSSAGAPTATECPASHLVVHKNTTSGVISLVYNDASTIHSIALV